MRFPLLPEPNTEYLYLNFVESELHREFQNLNLVEQEPKTDIEIQFYPNKESFGVIRE